MRVRIRGKFVVLFRATVAFCREEFDVWLLRWEEGHGVFSVFPCGSILVLLPERLVSETVIETGVGEGAEGKWGEEAGFFCFPEVVSGFKGVVMVDEVVGS